MSIHILELIQLVQDRQGEMIDLISDILKRETAMMIVVDTMLDQMKIMKEQLNAHLEGK